MPRSRLHLPLLLGSTLVMVASAGCRDVARPSPGPPAVVVATPIVRTVTEYYHYTGTTAPVESVEIRARVPGRLVEMTYTPSTRIDAGTLLFRIEPEPYQIKVDAAQADVDRAAAALRLARITQQRIEDVATQGGVTELEVLEANETVQQRLAELHATEQELAQARLDLGYTSVTAPIAGRVSRAIVDVGNLVGFGEPTLLTTITRMDPIWIYFDVSERIVLEYLDAGRRGEVGTEPALPPVELALASSPEDTYPFAGILNWVDSRVDEATGTIRVRGEIPNGDNALFPGLFVRARVPKRELVDALLIPENAIVTGLEGTTVLVVGADDVVERRAVALGPRDGAMRVIIDGVGREDRVVVTGVQKARPGQPVTVRTAPPSEGE